LVAASAAPVNCAPDNQHFYADVTAGPTGYFEATLQCPLGAVPAGDVVVTLSSGAAHLGGEDPSFATVNFNGFNATGTAVKGRIIGWHANVVTGIAEFKYYSGPAKIAVEVEHATQPIPPPTP
jgi:hypothetical protein